MAKDFEVAPLPEKTLTNISDCGYKHQSGMAARENPLVLPGFSDDESFELLLKFGKSSFLRKQESSPFKTFWISAGVYPVLDTGRE